MSSRSLNKVILIGNLTRDPELRYTPAGTAVCTFGIATNRQWTTQQGETKEEAEFHRVVAWNKLAELCSQLLAKGRKVFVEGRLSTHTWTGQDGSQRTTTEVVIEDMIILDSKKTAKEQDDGSYERSEFPPSDNGNLQAEEVSKENLVADSTKKEEKKKSVKEKDPKAKEEKSEEDPVRNEDITADDIPF